MSGFVDWMAAEADERNPAESALTVGQPVETPPAEQSCSTPASTVGSGQELPRHDVPPGVGGLEEAQLEDDSLNRDPDLWLYRSRTVGLLRRYMRFSIETGRLPSLVGREFFRAKVTSYIATTFEDRVIFVRDVEMILNRLQYWDQQIIARVILQEHDQPRAAHILHCSRSTLQRRLYEVLDLLSEDFLRVGLLSALPARDEAPE
jgi:hypothetical protein